MFCDMPLMPFSKHVHTTHWEGGNMIKKMKGCVSIRRKGLWYFFLQFHEHIITKKITKVSTNVSVIPRIYRDGFMT